MQHTHTAKKQTGDYKCLTNCLCCGGDVSKILDLGKQPLANSYQKTKLKQQEFPLVLNLCENCYHAQLSVAVNPKLMFQEYLYVSGTTKTLQDYFKWFASWASKLVNGKDVLEIACNDGSQLEEFKRLGYNVLGVDPARNLRTYSYVKGIDVIVGFWNHRNAKKMGRKFDLIVVQNVFAHVPNPYDFLMACKHTLKPGGKIIIQTSQAEMFFNGEYDGNYHEHISQFSCLSMKTLVNRAGLFVENFTSVPVHGSSYVFVIGNAPKQNRIQKQIFIEQGRGRYSIDLYTQFAKNARERTTALKKTIQYYRNGGAKIIGYGAAAKGNTLLNFGKLKLDYIVDDNPLKHGLYTPGMNIKIVEPEVLRNEKSPIVILPLSWNFFDEICERVKNLRNQSDVFIRYFPTLELCKN